MFCGFQYVKDACHKTIILPSPGASRIPGPRQHISGITQNFRFLGHPTHRGFWPGRLLATMASATDGLLRSECSLFCGLRTVLYAGSHLSGYYTPLYCAA
jgi:hypothetical protein